MAADARVMTRDQAERSSARREDVEGGRDSGERRRRLQRNIRFADNRISTAGGISTANLNIQSSFGRSTPSPQTI
jgi:hypothetical protein